LNFLISTLSAYDPENPLSQTAIDGFNAFQANVPFVAYTTLQMREAVSSGSLNGLVLEYQTFVNTSGLSGYEFVPFGVRHDNPLYSIGDLDAGQQYAVQAFADYCAQDSSQERAKECGFNDAEMDQYVSTVTEMTGDQIVSAQNLWKENKDVSKPITAVFVADISGSMDGEPLNQLKDSLVNASQYINSTNSIGLVSYSTDVYINLPIAQFDLNQRSYFAGAVQSLSAEGATATYDAVLVALDMLLQAKEENPNTKLVMFLLSDGAQNVGADLSDIDDILRYYGIAVYSIGYNADISELEQISSINEGAVINADSDDVIYKLKSLFNAQM
jgi:Ca-activated chloride channel family protein